MLDTSLRDLQRLTVRHESDCHCKYCRRRRLLFIKRITYYLFLSIAMVCLTVATLFIVVFLSDGVQSAKPLEALCAVVTIFAIGIVSLFIAVANK